MHWNIFDVIILYGILWNDQLAAFPNSSLVIWHQNAFRLLHNMFAAVLFGLKGDGIA